MENSDGLEPRESVFWIAKCGKILHTRYFGTDHRNSLSVFSEKLSAVLGNLAKKGLETGFLAQNLDRLLRDFNKDFKGPLSDRKAEHGFNTGDRILDRTLDKFSSRTGHPVLFQKTVLGPV